MNIAVLLKQTFDTEEKIVLEDGRIREDGAAFVINPYDEYAVEEALRIKERFGAHVAVVSVGPERASEALRTALAMGADEAALIADDQISDEFGTAEALAAWAGQHRFDLILGGHFSVDNGAGQVAVRVAHRLGYPHVSAITSLTLEPGQGKATVVRDAEGDGETLEVALPALFTAQQGLNEPRYPSIPGIMKAKKKPFRHWTLKELGLSETDVAPRVVRESLFLPPPRKAGRMISGDARTQAAELVRLLQIRHT